MSIRSSLAVATAIAVASTVLLAQSPASTKLPERSVRRDIPLTNMIRRAHAAGTRDSSGRPGRNYWQLATEYTIAAKFDAPTAMVSGHERVVIHNNSPDTLRTLQLRLDQNLFAANVPKAEKVTEITDGLKLSRLTIDDAAVDLARAGGRGGGGGGRGGRGGNAAPPAQSTIAGADVTTASVTLSHWIMPHGSATMEADWSFKVPRADGIRGIRMGSWGDSLYQVAQWYPRVAVYDDLRGWDTDPYLGPSEFYNNFGHFDYTLDLPAGWLVGATGLLQNPEQVLTSTARERLTHVLEADSQRTIVGADERGAGKSTLAGTGDRITWHFIADSVADVAWATSDRFVFDATRANIPGKGYIPYYLFYEPGNAGGGPGGGRAGGRGGFGAAAADSSMPVAPAYRGPFDVCTPTVGGGRGAGGGGGGGGGGRGFRNQGATGRHALEFYSKLWMPYAFPILQQVDGPEGGMEYPMFIMAAGSTDHETGHQWWPMMVGTNETWYGFMDEGFNQYMNRLSAADRAGNQPTNDCLGRSYGNTSGNEREAPLMWDANYGGPQYQFQAYQKAPLMLSMLGGVVGDSAVWTAMSDYAKAWRFKHPSPWDYAFFMDNALKKDLGWFWYYWLFTTESVDGSIENVSTTAAGHTVVAVRQSGQMPSPVVLGFQFSPKGPAIKLAPNAKKIDSMNVVVTYPVDVWFAGSKTFKADLNFGGRKIDKVTLDPYGRFPDRDPKDNVWPREK